MTPLLFSRRIFFAWVFALPAAYFFAGFMGNYHPAFLSVFLLALLAAICAGLYFYVLLGKAEEWYAAARWKFFIVLVLCAILAIFGGAIFNALKRFPAMFDTGYALLEIEQRAAFFSAMLVALPGLIFTRDFLARRNVRHTRIFRFVEENALGLLIAAFFFFVYFILSFTFNQPAFDTNDIFFDTDTWSWRVRFATDQYRDVYWRVAHPFILIIFRPVVAALALFLDGDRFAATFLLNALGGAACVFLAWSFVKQKTSDALYAALIAALFGGAAGQLIFGSLLETYVFLALISMLAAVWSLKDTPLSAFIVSGILAFGISMSGFIAPGMIFALQRRNLKHWLAFGLLLAASSVPLSLLNNAVYPDSQPYFFDLSAYDTEERNTFAPSIRRAMVVGRTMFAYSFVAPDPLVFRREFDFFKVWIVDVSRRYYPFDPDYLQTSEYDNVFGTALATAWLGLAALGGMGFVAQIFKKEDLWLSFAFILIILFEFFFRLRFGKELFLYAANWVYAITLFLALGWKNFAAQKSFQLALLIFIAAMLANNARLIFVMLGASAFVIH